jgi:hypothetical protein
MHNIGRANSTHQPEVTFATFKLSSTPIKEPLANFNTISMKRFTNADFHTNTGSLD